MPFYIQYAKDNHIFPVHTMQINSWFRSQIVNLGKIGSVNV